MNRSHLFAGPNLTRIPVHLLIRTIALVILSLAPLSARQQAVASVESGELEGLVLDEASGLRVFRGIPYALPPVGELRWRPPLPPSSWEGIRPAKEFGNACPQSPLIAFLSGEAQPPASEDCLTLNVWSSADVGEEQPVLVWIHGGGLTGGWAHQSLYDGAVYGRRGIVFVSIQYRLGPLGYFAHPALSQEGNGLSGNYGLLDQIAALSWIQRNIAAFGGDPKRVTLMGESAGGTSVVALYANPEAQGLFAGAIAQSPWRTEENVLPLREAEQLGLEYAELLVGEPADPLAELRALPADDLWRGLAEDFQPNLALGGWGLKSDPEEALTAVAADLPALIVGTTADEGTAFLPLFPIQSADGFQAWAKERYGDGADDIQALYSISSDEDLPGGLAHLITDTWFLRGARSLLRRASRSSAGVWQYVFTQTNPLMPALGAHHAVELPYVFDAIPKKASLPERELAERMLLYWIEFARTGNPNGEGLTPWPRFEEEREAYLELGTRSRSGERYRKEHCDFWDDLHSD